MPLAALVVVVARRHVPETRRPGLASRTLDLAGAALGAIGLGGVTSALIAGRSSGLGSLVLVGAIVGVAAWWRSSSRAARAHPMLPLDIFSSRQFTAANLVTFAVYAALGGVLFPGRPLQVVAGFSPLQAGTALLPMTLLHAPAVVAGGALAQRIGPRLPMTVGPLSAAVGVLLFRGVDEGASYVDRRSARRRRVRPRAVADGGAADGDRARRGTGAARGRGLGGEQRGGAGRGPPGGRRPAAARRPGGRGLRGPGRSAPRSGGRCGSVPRCWCSAGPWPRCWCARRARRGPAEPVASRSPFPCPVDAPAMESARTMGRWTLDLLARAPTAR